MYQHFVQNANLAPYNTYHIGGKAKCLAFVYDTDGLKRALELCPRFVVLGRGSKVLISDEGFDGTVILMRGFSVRDLDASDFIGATNSARNYCDANMSSSAAGSCGACGCLGDTSGNSIDTIDIITDNSFGNISGNKLEDIAENTDSEELDDSFAGVYAEAGVSLPYLSRLFERKGLAGLEWACAIPGSLGGALRLNAGAHGGDMAGLVVYTDVLRGGNVVRLTAAECGFAYRHSAFFPCDIILGACLRGRLCDKAKIAARRQQFLIARSNSQPQGSSCGSVFKAGEQPAYKYIEQCGLKGLTVGGAQISAMHGNFILNRGGARARDVFNLIRTAKAEVFTHCRVRLVEEVVYLGEF